MNDAGTKSNGRKTTKNQTSTIAVVLILILVAIGGVAIIIILLARQTHPSKPPVNVQDPSPIESNPQIVTPKQEWETLEDGICTLVDDPLNSVGIVIQRKKLADNTNKYRIVFHPTAPLKLNKVASGGKISFELSGFSDTTRDLLLQLGKSQPTALEKPVVGDETFFINLGVGYYPSRQEKYVVKLMVMWVYPPPHTRNTRPNANALVLPTISFVIDSAV